MITRRTPAIDVVQGTPLWPMIEMYEAELDYADLSRNTIRIYVGTVASLAEYLTEKHKITDWSSVRQIHVKGFILAAKRGELPRQKGAASDGYQSNLYRSLQPFFKWWSKEVKHENPMIDMDAPKSQVPPVGVLRQDQLDVLLATTEGADYVSRRDRAILLTLVDTGLRRAELAGINVADVDLDAREITIREENAKNRRPRKVGFGGDTRLALMRYINLARAGHPRHEDDQLWLGERGKGPLTPTGVYQMIRKRGKSIGVDPLYPHMLRHTWVHSMKKAGMQPDEIRAAAGWNSDAMLSRYAASTAAERATDTMRRSSPADQLRKGKRR